jgi:SAM-dependent methyltransferase
LLPGDAFTVDFGFDFDCVLTNFLHHFNKDECERLLQRIYRLLNPGGCLYILEFVPNSDRITPPIAASFSLVMLGLTPDGDAYTMQELEAMLVNSGFTHSELLRVPRSAQQVIVSTRAYVKSAESELRTVACFALLASKKLLLQGSKKFT